MRSNERGEASKEADRRVPTGERAAVKRAAIVRAACEVFVSRGFSVGVEAIAAEAGVSKVTIYNHFGSKEGLFKAVIGDELEAALGQTLAVAEEQLRSTDDIRQALVWTARAWVSGMTTPRVLALRTLITNELRRFPELGRAWESEGPGRFDPIFRETFQRLVEQGKMDIQDIDLAIVQLYALVLYPHFVQLTYGSTLDQQTADKLITHGVEMFLTYYDAGREPRGGSSARA